MKKIFVGGLPSAVTEADFRSYFEQFGPITDVVVMYDHGMQRPRGFGFITYESEVSVERVLRKTFHDLKDKRVEVKRAVPKDVTTLSGLNHGTSRAVGLGGARSTTSSYGGGICAQAFNPISRYNMRSDTNLSSSSSSPVGQIDHAVAYRPVRYGNRSPASTGLHNEAPYRVSPNGSSAYGSIGGDTVSCNAYGSYISGDTISSNAYPGRNVWSIDSGSYGSSLASSAGYQASATLSNHGEFGVWTPPQPSNTRNSVAYNDRSYYRFRDGSNASLIDSASFSYAGQNGGYGPFPRGDRSAAAGGNDSLLFGGIHSFTSSGYSASTWQPSANAFDSSSTAFGGIFGTRSSFARDDDGGDAPAVDDGYAVQGRLSYRGNMNLFHLHKQGTMDPIRHFQARCRSGRNRMAKLFC
jgi:RNA-binding protein Musashi